MWYGKLTTRSVRIRLYIKCPTRCCGAGMMGAAVHVCERMHRAPDFEPRLLGQYIELECKPYVVWKADDALFSNMALYQVPDALLRCWDDGRGGACL